MLFGHRHPHARSQGRHGAAGQDRGRPGLLATAAVAAALAASPALAQSAKPANQVQEIIVTAQRRAERLQDVPIAITNVDSQQLERSNAQMLSDIVKLTPGLRYDYQGMMAQATIRGVGTQLVGVNAGSNVGTYIDGFYVGHPFAFDQALLNVESVQVLKGPQGTLFGRNTSGGAVLITTTKPSTDTHGMVEASYGNHNAYEFKGYGTVGLTDKVAVDIGGMYEKGDGYVRNIVTNSKTFGNYENWGVRVGLKADITDTLSVLVRYAHQDTDDARGITGNAYVLDGRPATLAAIIPGAIIATKPGEVSYTVKSPYRDKSDSYQLTITEDLSFASLTSYTGYRQDRSNYGTELTFSSPELIHLWALNPQKVFTQEFLLASHPGNRLQWTAGAFFLKDSGQTYAFIGQGEAPATTYAGGSTAVEQSLAAYADATYAVIEDRLFITAGLRYTRDEMKDAVNLLAVNPFGYPNLHNNNVSPRFVLRYAPDRRQSVYASFSKGFKSGMWSLGGSSVIPVKPEHITAYEVGYKYSAGGLSFDAAAYFYDWKNIQVSNLRVVNGATLQDTTNAARTHIYGVEGQLRYAVNENFDFNLGAAYVHANYKSFNGAPSYAPCLDFAACGAAYGIFVATPINASGNMIPRSPRFTGTAGATYAWDVARGRLALTGNLYYTSKFYFDPANQFVQKGYATLGARAAWTDPSDRYTLAIYGDNLTGERYRSQVLASSPGIANVWAASRTFGVSAAAKFH
jgi:iron complex outermembrane receptor protein